MSEIGNVCNPVEDHCVRAMKIVHHHANSSFDWLISGHQSLNPSREIISILSGKYKRFMFVHPVSVNSNVLSFNLKLFRTKVDIKSVIRDY